MPSPIPIRVLILVSVLTFARAFAEEDAETACPKLAYGAEADFAGRYVWRGIRFSKGPVVQPSAWISGCGFILTTWGNLVLNNEIQRGQINETDLILTYGRSWRKFSIEPTFQSYINRPLRGTDDPITSEASLKVSYPIGPWRVFASQSVDVLAHRGAYFGEAGVSYKGRMSGKVSLASSVSTGCASSKFNAVYLGMPRRTFSYVEGDLSLTYRPNGHLYLRPHAELHYLSDGNLRRQLKSATMANVGLALGVEF